MKYPLVSIIIPTYNHIDLLDGCLPDIFNQDYPKNKLDVIVVDDASTEDVTGFLKKNYPNVRTLRLKKNSGYTVANNEGYKITKGKYVVLINNDVFMPRNWLKPLVDVAENDEKVAIVSSMIFPSPRKRPKLIADEKLGEKMNITATIAGRSDPNKDTTTTLFGCATSCLIRKRVLDRPYDPDYIAMHEDVYTSWVALLKGYKIHFEKKSKIWHMGQVTYGVKTTPKYIFLSEKNRFLNMLLFLKIRTMILLSPIIYTDFMFRLLDHLVKLRFDLILAEFRAIFWNIRRLKSTLKKRRNFQKTRKVPDSFILTLFCEDVYGTNSTIKRILNLMFKSYFRLVKKITKICGI